MTTVLYPIGTPIALGQSQGSNMTTESSAVSRLRELERMVYQLCERIDRLTIAIIGGAAAVTAIIIGAAAAFVFAG